MAQPDRTSFGIMTAPMYVDYHDLAKVWRDADAIDEIEHAWVFDHLLPISSDLGGPIYEGWTLRWRPRPDGSASGCSSPATASVPRPCWPRSPRPSTPSRTGGSTSASAPDHDRAGPTHRVSTRRTDCRSATPPTPSRRSRRRAS